MNCNVCYNLDFYKKVGYIPSTYKVAMTYEEQLLWLCQQVEALKEGTANYNYDLLENKPSIDGVILQGNVTKSQLGIDMNYYSLFNKPSINSIVLQGNKSLNELGIQAKLIAGAGINISGNTISVVGGGGTGTTDYRALYYKPSINGVTLEDNKTGVDLYLQDELSISWINSLQVGKTLDITNVQVGDTILPPYSSLILDTGESYFALYETDKHNGDYFDFEGRYKLVALNEANEVTVILDSDTVSDHAYFKSSGEGKLFIAFLEVETIIPSIKQIETGIGNWDKERRLDEKIRINDYDLYRLLDKNIGFTDYTLDLDVGQVYSYNSQTLDVSTVSVPYSASMLVDGRILYSHVYLQGQCESNPMIIYIDSNYKAIKAEHTNESFSNSTLIKLNIPENCRYIAFNFTDTNTLLPNIKLLDIAKFDDGVNVTTLTSNVILLVNNELTLDSGFYKFDDSHAMYYHTSNVDNLIYGYNDGLFYFDKDNQTIYLDNKTYYYDTFDTDWGIFEHSNITNQIVNERGKIPTSQAVYNHHYFESLKYDDSEDILDHYQDGFVYIKEFTGSDNTIYDVNSFFAYYNGAWREVENRLTESLNLSLESNVYSFTENRISYSSSEWHLTQNDRSFSILNVSSSLATGANGSCPTNKQVRDYVASQITYGTSDLTPGTSPLTTGAIYLVYEA